MGESGGELIVHGMAGGGVMCIMMNCSYLYVTQIFN